MSHHSQHCHTLVFRSSTDRIFTRSKRTLENDRPFTSFAGLCQSSAGPHLTGVGVKHDWQAPIGEDEGRRGYNHSPQIIEGNLMCGLRVVNFDPRLDANRLLRSRLVSGAACVL